MNRSHLFGFLIFSLALAYSFYGLTVGFSHSLYDEHSFRQTQTAITAYFLAKGGPFFNYETPLLGPPWTIPFELPVYQWLVAKLHGLSSFTLEESARLVGRFFFYLSLLPLYAIFRSLRFHPLSCWVGLTLYLLSPLYLFWSRTFLIESTALFFALGYLAFFLHGWKKPSVAVLIGLAVFGSLAGTVKVTTAFTFFLVAGILYLWLWRNPRTWKESWTSLLLFAFAAFVLPGIVSFAWIQYSDLQKSLSGLAEFIRSKELEAWNFGTWAQRISGDTWYMFFRKTLHDSIGHRTTFLISLACLPFLSKRILAMAVACLVAFLVAPMVFTNLHIEHTYYWYANGIFLLIYLALVFDGIWKMEWKWKSALFVALFATAAGLSVREYSKFFLEVQKRNDQGIPNGFQKLRAALSEEDVVVFVGADWYPAMAWEVKRRSIMVRTEPGIQSQAFRESLRKLKQEKRRVGAIVECDLQGKNASVEREWIQKYFVLQAEPLDRSICLQTLVTSSTENL